MADVLTDEYFEKFRNLIYDQSGIHFTPSNRPILESRLRERIRLAGLETVGPYFDLIKKNPDELKTFLDSITTNLTRFFRHQGHWDSFINHVLPDLIKYKKAKGETKFRVWSAGCSTGEEPYTIAMILEDKLPPGFSYEITASDLSLKCLMTASQGYYAEQRIVGIPDPFLPRFFTRADEGHQIKPEIKAKIKFDYHNLKFESGYKNMDVVFCRNVLIYFDEAAQKNVVEKFYNAMTGHSYLYIGHSESLFGMNTQFKFLKTDWAVLYTKHLE